MVSHMKQWRLGSSSPSYIGMWGIWWRAIVEGFYLGWERAGDSIEFCELGVLACYVLTQISLAS